MDQIQQKLESEDEDDDDLLFRDKKGERMHMIGGDGA